MIRVFFDGNCGFCHRAVRFALLRLDGGPPLLFSPLFGNAYKRIQPGIDLPQGRDSILVYDESEKKLLARGAAIVHLMRYLRRPWPFIGQVLQYIPKFLLNGGYWVVARLRYFLAKRPDKQCPIVPQELRKYFED